MINKYDWNKIQASYNSGASYSTLKQIYGISHQALTKAVNRGVFIPRTSSEANKNTKYDRVSIWTPERRKLQSEAKKKLYRDHPEKHPNRKLANNRQKMSYPEKIVYDWLTSQGIEFIHQRRIESYYVDFNIGVLCIEVDGKYFHNTEYDAIRDSKIESLGFTIKRISASNIIKHGGCIVLDDSISPELLATHIELRKPKVCPVCDSIYYGNKKSCSDKCKKELKLTHSITVKTKTGIKIVNLNSLPPISKDELIIRLNNGVSFTSMGAEYGVSDNAVRKWCKKYDIDYKRQKQVDESKLIEMINNGCGVSEIARKFGVTRERLHNISIKLGLSITNKTPDVIPLEVTNKVKMLIKNGYKNCDIIPIVGLNQKQISAIRVKYGIN